MALVSYDQSDHSSEESDVDEDEKKVVTLSESGDQASSQFADAVEDEYKMRIPANAKPIFKPLNIQKKTLLSGKVLLSVPTLEELDSSSESDNDEERKSNNTQKIRPSDRPESKSLLEMLPPTRALIVREGDRPMMVPHQLMRPRTVTSSSSNQNTTALKPNIASTSTAKLTFADDDEFEDEAPSVDETELESGSFFSFYDAEKEGEKWAASRLSASSQPLLVSHQPVELLPKNSSIPVAVPVVTQNTAEPTITCSNGLPVLAEKPFSDWELSRIPTRRPKGAEGDEGIENDEDEEPVWTESTFIPGPERKRARFGAFGQPSIGAHASPVISLLNSSKTEVKEVNQDDLTAGAKLELIKSITTDDHRRRQKADLVDEPGKLAFRKHQITWLAYKAQDQEYELQEKWAEARRNATQSRAKYGF